MEQLARGRGVGAAADRDQAPVVSCVLIFLDGARFIDEAIRSVVTQSGLDDWELILVDDGSADESTAIARAWAAKDPDRISYVDHPGHENLGMSASRNLGVSVATGTYVAFLDCDDVWLPSSLVHRMRVAASHPDADIVVSGTWRWHSWTGEDAAWSLDEPMPLPAGPLDVTLPPPRLFSAIYGIPGGGHVPAMCSVLLRRTALLALGGMESQFRGLFEDQVLYVKAGLQLRAVIDARRLALYRQHPDSACSVSIADGSWSRTGASEPTARFLTWMSDHVRHEAGEGSAEAAIVEANIAFRRGEIAPPPSTVRALVCRHIPRPVGDAVRSLRARHRRPRQHPTVLAEWSAQHLTAIVTAVAGEVLVVAPTGASRDPWTGHIPGSAFGPTASVTRRRVADLDDRRFDHVIVPLDAAREWPLATILQEVRGVLRPGGTVVLLLPGPALVAGTGSPAVMGFDGDIDAVAAVHRLAAEHLPNLPVSVESFGNAVTARAVAAGSAASAVPGVALDHHDGHTHVVLAVSSASLHAIGRNSGSVARGSRRVRDVARGVGRKVVPWRVRHAWRRLRRLPLVPRVGEVQFGDFRRTTPIATDFGYSRGGPVDRYYIEAFLEEHRLDICGRVLEIGDDTYTQRFGGTRVRFADVLHVDADAAGATFVGDLADGSFLPTGAFDCVILTQTLHLVYDHRAALRTVARVLAPGGVLLMTVPGISNTDPGEWGSTWHYSFTEHAVRRMCDETFTGFDVRQVSYGNVLAAVAFLHGLGRDELTRAELDDLHPEYGLIHAARVRKPAGGRSGPTTDSAR